jgi:SAM-dependent methyltransferase
MKPIIEMEDMQNRRDNINFYDEQILPQDFHMPGIEPWVSMMLKRHKPNFVLDLGTGMGFWGFLIKSYITRNLVNSPTVIGLDLDVSKLRQLKRMKVYDELVCADIRYLPFRSKTFDTIIAIETLYLKEFPNIVKEIENLAIDRGVVIFSRGVSGVHRKILVKNGYDIYHVYLRGLMLERVNDKIELFSDKQVRMFSIFIKIFYKVFKPKARDYVIALKLVGDTS